MAFFMAPVIGIALLLWALWKSLKWNKFRTLRKYSYNLFPNCLITRHPVVFVSGRKSIFYFGRYWNFLPQFLRDHGYEILELDLPWRDPEERRIQALEFTRLLQLEGLKAHFIGDVSSTEILDTLKTEASDVVASSKVMDLQTLGGPTLGSTPWAYRLHQIFIGHRRAPDGRVLGLTEVCELKELGRAYLRHLVELAEDDLTQGDAPHEHQPQVEL